MSEWWLPVPGYEGYYEVSDQGRVRSVERLVNAPQCGGTQLKRGRVLRPGLRNHYLSVILQREGKRTNYTVHQIVAAAFIGPCPSGMEVRHGPNGKTDNRPSNLTYGTRAENMADKRRDGTWQGGSAHHAAKLTEQTVAAARTARATGESVTSLAKRHGVAYATMWDALNRRWQHVGHDSSPEHGGS